MTERAPSQHQSVGGDASRSLPVPPGTARTPSDPRPAPLIPTGLRRLVEGDPPGAGPGAGPAQQRLLLGLQPIAGNHAILRLLHRTAPGATAVAARAGPTAPPVVQRGPTTKLPNKPSKDPSPASLPKKAPASEAAFRGATFTEPVFRPTSGGASQFFIQYAPKTGTLTIGVKARADFRDSASLVGSGPAAKATAEPEVDKKNALLIDRINDAPAAARAQNVEDWRWQPAETSTWALELQNTLKDTWATAATKLSFVLNKPGWSAPLPTATVVIVVEVVDAKGSQVVTGPVVPINDRHLDMRVWKRPPNGITSDLQTSSKDSVHATMELSSGSVRGRRDNPLVYDWDPSKTSDKDMGLPSITAWGSDHKSAATALGPGGGATAKGKVPVTAGEPFKLEAKGSNAAQRDKDAAAVTDALVKGCGDAGRAVRLPDQPTLPRGVRITLGDGTPQKIAAHEFGHLFGLSDEYAQGVNPVVPPGQGASHSGLAASMGPKGPAGAMVESNDNVMSEGNTVRAQHYSVFLDALRKVTGHTEWQLA
jgi:hypothetical protein